MPVQPARSSSQSRLKTWAIRFFWIGALLAALGMMGANKLNRSLGNSGSLEAVQTKARIQLIGIQLKVMRQIDGRYPSEEEGLEGLTPENLRAKNPERVRGLFLDFWQRKIRYRNPGQHHPDGFDLYSLGADGVEGTEDDITNWEEAAESHEVSEAK